MAAAKEIVSEEKAPEHKLGYKGKHVEGSRKGKVHELFDAKGQEAAWTLGLKLGLKEGTLRSWLGAWRKENQREGSAEKQSAKPVKPAEKMENKTHGQATSTTTKFAS